MRSSGSSSGSSSGPSSGSISAPRSGGASTAISAGVAGITAGAGPAGKTRQTPLRSRCRRSQPSRWAWWRRSSRPRKPDRSSMELPGRAQELPNLAQIDRAVGGLLKMAGQSLSQCGQGILRARGCGCGCGRGYRRGRRRRYLGRRRSAGNSRSLTRCGFRRHRFGLHQRQSPPRAPEESRERPRPPPPRQDNRGPSGAFPPDPPCGASG